MALYPNDEDEQDEVYKLLDAPLDEIDEEDDNEGGMTLFPSSDEEEIQNDKAENAKEIARRLEKLEEENRALRERPAQQQQYQQPYQAPVYQQQQQQGFFQNSQAQDDALVTELNTKFGENPGRALLEIYRKGKQDAEEAARKNLYPVAAQNTKFAINQYANTANMDADTKAEFQKLTADFTPQQLAAAAENPQALDQHLELIRKIAWANAAEKREKSNGRRNTPPPFAGGSSGRGRAEGGIKVPKGSEYTVKLAKAQGFTDKQIAEMLRKGEI